MKDSFDYVEWSYRTFLQGKAVAIVGGSCEKWESKPEDGIDVTVRINSHVERQGGRCDVLYHTCVPCLDASLVDSIGSLGCYPSFVFLNLIDGDFESKAKLYPQYLDFLCELRSEFPATDVGYFAQGQWLERNPYGPQYEWLNQLHKRYETKLFTGLVALAHILRAAPASVRVFGMNMYTDKTGGKLVSKVESHELEGNLIFLRDVRKDPRVVFDKELTEALRLYGII